VDERVEQGGEPVTEAEQNAAVPPGKPETLSARAMAKPPSISKRISAFIS